MYLVGPTFFSGGKAAGFKFNHLLPCSIEVKNVWSFTSTAPVSPHVLDMDDFTLPLQITSCLSLNSRTADCQLPLPTNISFAYSSIRQQGKYKPNNNWLTSYHYTEWFKKMDSPEK